MKWLLPVFFSFITLVKGKPKSEMIFFLHNNGFYRLVQFINLWNQILVEVQGVAESETFVLCIVNLFSGKLCEIKIGIKTFFF